MDDKPAKAKRGGAAKKAVVLPEAKPGMSKQERLAALAGAIREQEGPSEAEAAAAAAEAAASKKRARADEDDEDDASDSSVGEDAPVEATAEDNAFIDDAGAAARDDKEFDEVELSDDEAAQPYDSIMSTFKRDGRDKSGNDVQALEQLCKAFLVRMQEAAAMDNQNNAEKKLAVHKLRLLSEAERTLRMRNSIDIFVTYNVFHVIAKWLLPLPDGSMPNADIRSSMLETLLVYPIDLDKIKESGLGRIVKYMSLNDELEKNRKVAKKIIDKWSRPIFRLSTDYSAYAKIEEDRIAASADAVRERNRSVIEADKMDRSKQKSDMAHLKPTDKGFRHKVRIPTASAVEYTIQPQSKVSAEGRAERRVSEAQKRLDKKLSSARKKK